MEYVESSVDELTATYPNAQVIIGGDFNQLSETEILERTGLEQIVKQPTRGSSRLDRIYVLQPCYERVQVITSLVPSDHKVIIASSCKDGTVCRDKKVTICKHRAVNPKLNARFLANLPKFDFQEDNSRSAQEEFNQFYKELESLLDTYYPERDREDIK